MYAIVSKQRPALKQPIPHRFLSVLVINVKNLRRRISNWSFLKCAGWFTEFWRTFQTIEPDFLTVNVSLLAVEWLSLMFPKVSESEHPLLKYSTGAPPSFCGPRHTHLLKMVEMLDFLANRRWLIPTISHWDFNKWFFYSFATECYCSLAACSGVVVLVKKVLSEKNIQL